MLRLGKLVFYIFLYISLLVTYIFRCSLVILRIVIFFKCYTTTYLEILQLL